MISNGSRSLELESSSTAFGRFTGIGCAIAEIGGSDGF
jgi:hypothetical protein